MPRDWQSLVAGMTDVQTLVHLAMRLDDFEIDRIRGELLREGRAAYEHELTIQARLVGCRSRSGRLTSGPSLTALNNEYQRNASSIVGTYNYDLGIAIIGIGNDVPTANRHVYASRLSGWESARAIWKNSQVAEYTVGYARALAQSDFHTFNDVTGYAVLEPTTAVCPVCAGWVARNRVPIQEATRNPPPYHVNCPHGWRMYPGKVADCSQLWMGD